MLIGISGLANSGKDTVADCLVKNNSFTKMALADEMKRSVIRIFDFSEEQMFGPSEKRNAPDKRYPRTCGLCEGTGLFTTEWYGTKQHLSSDKVQGCQECNGEKKVYLTPRHALQQLGTEFGRGCYEDIWVDFTLNIAKKLLTPISVMGHGQGWCQYTPQEGLGQHCTVDEVTGVVITDCRFKNELEAIRKESGILVRIKREEYLLSGNEAQHTSETEQQEIPDDYFDYILENNGTLEDLYKKVEEMYEHFRNKDTSG